MAEKPKLEARIPASVAMTVRVVEVGGGGTVTVTVVPALAAGYYLTSATAYLTTIANALTNDATLAGTYTLTISDGNDSATGKSTLAATGITSFTLTWSDTTYGPTIAAALGFDDPLDSGLLSYTSPSASPYLWLPPVGRTTGMGPEPSVADQFGAETSDLVVTEAPSGASKAFSYGRRDIERIAFANVIGSKMFERRASVTNEALQTFWQKLIDDSGMRFRYHPDRSNDAIYLGCVAKAPMFAPEPATDPTNEGAYSLWNIAWDVIKHV